MPTRLAITDFLATLVERPLFDVRTPAEFEQGHIPGAINLPLFRNEERAVVGTIYKNEGKEEAMFKALEFVGPRMTSLVDFVKQNTKGEEIAVHCWRGGKRSESVAWLLEFFGYDAVVLKDGYKAFRRHVLSHFENSNHPLIVLGGRTGSRKTEILKHLSSQGEQVIDLEALANHKGSAFGWIGQGEQPSSEMFENLLFSVLSRQNPEERIWVENESRTIGKVRIPEGFWRNMKDAPLIHTEVPLEVRVRHLINLYADNTNPEDLIEAFRRVDRRLGGQHVKEAIEAIQRSDFQTATFIALKYYDKTYDYNLSVNQAPHIAKVILGEADPSDAARLVKQKADAIEMTSTSR